MGQLNQFIDSSKKIKKIVKSFQPAGPGQGGPVHFADFSLPATVDWWYTISNNYRQKLEWDGLWLVSLRKQTLCLNL